MYTCIQEKKKKKSIAPYYFPSGVANLILEKTVPINNDVHARSGFQIFIVTNNEANLFFLYVEILASVVGIYGVYGLIFFFFGHFCYTSRKGESFKCG